MGDILAYEAELLGLVREVGFPFFFVFFFSGQNEQGKIS